MGAKAFAGGERICPPWASIVRAAAGVFAAAAGALVLGAAPALANPSPYLAGDRSLVDEYATIEGAKLGVLLPGGPDHFIEIKESPKTTIPSPWGPSLGGADCVDSTGATVGPTVGCVIELAATPHKNGELRQTVAHEVFHVFQALMSGTLENYLGAPRRDWLIEGSAQWVESELIKKDRGARDDWKRYLRTPETQVTARAGANSYSAIGFFAHMNASGISPWTRLRSMFEAKGSPASWAAGVGGDKAFLDTEASAFFRTPHLGPEWDTRGQNVPSAAEVGFKPTAVSFTKSSPRTLTVKPYADGAYDLSISGLSVFEPVLEVTVGSGEVRLRSTSGGHVDAVDPKQVLLCSDPKGCSCPLRPNHYEQFQRGDLAITGGSTGGKVTLTPRKPCEALLPAVACQELLPGFRLLEPLGSPIAAQHTSPGGSTAYTCALLEKGAQATNAAGETSFVGVLAPLVSELHATSVGGAKSYYKVISGALPSGYVASTPSGVGEEAELLTKGAPNAAGQVEYASFAIVRVQNIVVEYALVGTAGNLEADPAESLRLLQRVARGL